MARVKGRRIRAPKIVEPGGYLKFWLLLCAAAVLTGWSWFAYEIGRQDAGFHSAAANDRQQRLQAQIRALEKERERLWLTAANYQRASQIDRDAARRVQQDIKSLQDERAELKREVAFLKELIANDDGPIQVRDFRLRRGGAAREYFYAFTVSNARRDLGELNGQIKIAVRGEAEGVARYLRLGDLTGGKLSAHKMRFKHFQDVQGKLVLPEDFSPQTITVEIVPQEKTVKNTQRTFDWRLADV
jgi:hypothetical protein